MYTTILAFLSNSKNNAGKPQQNKYFDHYNNSWITYFASGTDLHVSPLTLMLRLFTITTLNCPAFRVQLAGVRVRVTREPVAKNMVSDNSSEASLRRKWILAIYEHPY